MLAGNRDVGNDEFRVWKTQMHLLDRDFALKLLGQCRLRHVGQPAIHHLRKKQVVAERREREQNDEGKRQK